jgi:SMC interacting uncharacterized protein involved in chromosome segregation
MFHDALAQHLRVRMQEAKTKRKKEMERARGRRLNRAHFTRISRLEAEKRELENRLEQQDDLSQARRMATDAGNALVRARNMLEEFSRTLRFPSFIHCISAYRLSRSGIIAIAVRRCRAFRRIQQKMS